MKNPTKSDKQQIAWAIALWILVAITLGVILNHYGNLENKVQSTKVER